MSACRASSSGIGIIFGSPDSSPGDFRQADNRHSATTNNQAVPAPGKIPGIWPQSDSTSRKCCVAIKADLLATSWHREKLDKLGDPQAEIDSCIDFAARAARAARAAQVDRVAPRSVSEQAGNIRGRTTGLTFENWIGEAGAQAICDATRVPTPTQHNRRGDNAPIKQGARPADWKSAKPVAEGYGRDLDEETRQGLLSTTSCR